MVNSHRKKNISSWLAGHKHDLNIQSSLRQIWKKVQCLLKKKTEKNNKQKKYADQQGSL